MPFTADSAEYTALNTGQVDIGVIPKADLPPRTGSSPLPPSNPLGSNYNLQPFYSFGIYYAQPNFNNPQVGFMVRQLYMRQALQMVFDQPGIDKAIYRGYAVPNSGPARTRRRGTSGSRTFSGRTTARARTRLTPPRRSRC